MATRGRVFDEEKVLYFADQEAAFHVQPGEAKNTDVSNIVRNAVRNGHLVRVEAGKSGEFYATTKAGKIRLLQLQIEWRKTHGKATAEHEAELAQLQEQNHGD